MKKIILTLFGILFITGNVIAAPSGGESESTSKKTNYEKAVSHIKSAKKYEKKGKLEKAKKITPKHKNF